MRGNPAFPKLSCNSASLEIAPPGPQEPGLGAAGTGLAPFSLSAQQREADGGIAVVLSRCLPPVLGPARERGGGKEEQPELRARFSAG